MSTFSPRALAVAAVCCLFVFTVQPARAEFTIVFDGGYGSSSDTIPTGASAKMVVTLSDTVDNKILVELKITNTTDSINSLFGASTEGATSSKLTGVAFDLPDSGNYVANSYTPDPVGFFPNFIGNASFNPFGVFDGAASNHSNFMGGNSNDALPEDSTATVSFKIDTQGQVTAAAFENAWRSAATMILADGTIVEGFKFGARFQQVNAGEGSDKLLGGLDPNDPVTVVPTPSSLALFAIGMVSAAGCSRRRRNRSRVMAG